MPVEHMNGVRVDVRGTPRTEDACARVSRFSVRWQARGIHAAPRLLVPGLDHPRATEHELDAVVCALTAQLWLAGRARVVGLAEEGMMVVADVQ